MTSGQMSDLTFGWAHRTFFRLFRLSFEKPSLEGETAEQLRGSPLARKGKRKKEKGRSIRVEPTIAKVAPL